MQEMCGHVLAPRQRGEEGDPTKLGEESGTRALLMRGTVGPSPIPRLRRGPLFRLLRSARKGSPFPLSRGPRTLAVIALTLALAACGVKGDLEPPPAAEKSD
jgi:hypothetical protein